MFSFTYKSSLTRSQGTEDPPPSLFYLTMLSRYRCNWRIANSVPTDIGQKQSSHTKLSYVSLGMASWRTSFSWVKSFCLFVRLSVFPLMLTVKCCLANGLWARRDLYRVAPSMTRLALCGVIRMPTQIES